MNKIISPAAALTSFMTAFSLSSNSPLYFAPAISAAKSKTNIFLLCRFSGTSCLTILHAIPSTIAVFPTPASPINIGLFFFLRDKMCKILLISSSRPTMGSSFPLSARSFRLIAYLFNALYSPSAC